MHCVPGGVLASDDRRHRHRPSSPPARSAAVLAEAMRCWDAFLDGRDEVGWADAQSGEQRGVEIGGTGRCVLDGTA